MLATSLLVFAGCKAGGSANAADQCKQDYLKLTGRVVDQANLLSPPDEARLSAKLERLEAKTRHQLVIATTPSLQGKPIETYSLCLARHWGVGRKGHDDGVVILVAPVEKKVRIEVGIGLEDALTNAEANTVLDRHAIPAFRDGDFAGAIEQAADGIIAQVSVQ